MSETETKEEKQEEKNEEQEPITDESVQAKIDAGEELTKEEEDHVLKQDDQPAEGYANTEDISQKEFDEIEESKAEDEEGGEKKDEKGEEKKEEEKKDDEGKTDEQKAQEAKDKEAEEDAKDPFLKIERELAKPENEADIKDFSDREKAYYHQMRRDRQSRQKAEKERDGALSENEQLKKSQETKASEETDPIEELKKKDPSDFMTVEDVLKIIDKKPATSKPKEEAQPAAGAVDPAVLNFLKMAEESARTKLDDDFDEVMELADEIITNNPRHLEDIAKAMQKGENPAVVSYNLIKGDPEFAKLLPAAQLRVKARKPAKTSDSAPSSDKDEKGKEETPKKEEEKPEKSEADKAKETKAKQAQDALKTKKPKTTGHLDTQQGGEKFGDYTAEQIAAMPQSEFNKIPKKERDRYLKLYG